MTSKQQSDVFVRNAAEDAAPAVLIGGDAAPVQAVREPLPDVWQILNSVGGVAYDWRIETDRILWGGNVGEVLKLDPDQIATGADYARFIGAKSSETRLDAVMHSGLRDSGSGVPFLVQYCLQRTERDGELWVEDVGRWFAGPDGRPARAHGVMRVFNDRRQGERLDHLSRFDGLTGELNRWQLVQVLAETLDEAARFRTSCGFLLVAIDNLDGLNESYGFRIGDEVIAGVAKRIRSRMRGADRLGRYSGNRFGLVLKTCTPEDLATAVHRLMSAVRDEMVPTSIGPVAVTVTAGGIVAPRHARTIDEVQVRAQETLGRAKRRRRGSFLAYRPCAERESLRRENARATDEIAAALNERRVAIAYEPVAETGSREIAFVECLMRVQRPDGTLQPAQDIIPVAERLGLVRLLDHRVLELTVNALTATPGLRASLNVSPPSTTDPEWWSGLNALLRSQPGVGERLTIEIAEGAVLYDVDETRGFIAGVKDLGCRIAIDDFGAGYTAFRTLRELGVDMIKIDGALVRDVPHAADARAVVQTLLDLARRLGLQTVAEWVQDEDSAALLAGWGCDYLQGALIGLASERPAMPPAAGARSSA